MFSLLVWCVYRLFVGSIAKSIVPGDENFGFVKTVALGVAGSYMGGALLYLIGSYDSLSSACPLLHRPRHLHRRSHSRALRCVY